MELKEKVKKRSKDLKAYVEKLNVQLHLGAAEAKDEFENQKRNIREWTHTTRQNLSEYGEKSEEKVKQLQSKIDELRVQAELGKAETEEVLQDQQKKIRMLIHEVEVEAKALYNTSEGKLNELSSDIRNEVDYLKTSFDLFKLRLAYAKTETKEAWEAKKKEIVAELNELKNKIEEEKSTLSENWNKFKSEMSESAKHFKKAF